MRSRYHLAALLTVTTSVANSADWPQWRGPHRDGRSPEVGLATTWPEDGPPLLWTASGLGAGYSTISVVDGRIFTQGATGGREYVIGLDATTGRELWRTANGREFRNNRGGGPRGAPTVDGERLYALGGNGDLACLDTATGERLWHVNLLDAFGGRNISWGMSESPLVLEDRLLVNAGGRGASVVALDKSDGSLIWRSESDEAGYSSAVIATIHGVRQAVFFTGERVIALNVEDGSLLWHYRRVSNRTANVATPIVRGNHVFVSSDYGTGCALLEIDSTPEGMSAREIYFNRDMRNHHASSVLVVDTLYGFSSSILTAMDFLTGELLWRDRSVGKGSLIYGDGHLYAFSENGVMGLVEASRQGYREKGRFRLPERSDRPSWSHPVIADGKLFLRDQDRLYAYEIAEGGVQKVD